MSLKYIDRRGMDSVKWDGMWSKYGSDELLPLWIADMDFECADCIRDALSDYAKNVPLGYAMPPDDYYDAFIEWESKYHGYDVKREWICFSPGVVSGFYWSVLMLTKPGDGVITLTPVYYPMLNAVKDNDRKLIMCDLVRSGMDYSIDFERFEQDIVENGVKLFIFCSPANPVGRIWTAEEIKKLMEICEKHGVYVVSDEIHQDFEWEDHKHIPTATLGDYDSFLITMTSASKSFNIAAAQNSIIIIPDDELRARYKDFQNRIHVSSGNAFGYVAAAAAYRKGREWLEEVKAQIWSNYEYVKAQLAERAPEIEVGSLQGTYLLWLGLNKYFQTQEEVSDFCENRCGLAFDYGSWFGGDRFAPFVRMNLSTSRENIEEAVNKMADGLTAMEAERAEAARLEAEAAAAAAESEKADPDRKKPVLVIMAAGMGSRYGGLKQIDQIGSNGEIIIDFTLYDAWKAGFETAICIIKKEIEEDFKALMERGAAKHMNILYAYQDMTDIPAGIQIPEGRVKPWGTGHAILAARNIIDAPFAVVNADDYYGPGAFKTIYDYLSHAKDGDKYDYCMVAYQVENTLSEHGSVARGVCTMDDQGHLKKIDERTKIQWNGDKIQFTEDDGASWTDVPVGTPVSMNLFGFTPSIITELKARLPENIYRILRENPLKGEFYIPIVTSELIQEGKADVKVLHSPDKWYGVTYKEDRQLVVDAMLNKKKEGIYPDRLWD